MSTGDGDSRERERNRGRQQGQGMAAGEERRGGGGMKSLHHDGEAAYIMVARVTQERKAASRWCKPLVKGEWPGRQESQARGEVEGPQAAGGLCGSGGADSLLTAMGTGRHSFLRGSPPPLGWDSHPVHEAQAGDTWSSLAGSLHLTPISAQVLHRASLVAQLVKNLPAMWETLV